MAVIPPCRAQPAAAWAAVRAPRGAVEPAAATNGPRCYRYIKRKTKDGFRSAQSITDPAQLDLVWKQAGEQLKVAQRQLVVYSLYSHGRKSVMVRAGASLRWTPQKLHAGMWRQVGAPLDVRAYSTCRRSCPGPPHDVRPDGVRQAAKGLHSPQFFFAFVPLSLAAPTTRP